MSLASPTDEHAGRLSDEVELYQRTYNTLLRSSGETHLRVLEPAHRAMGSSLHPLADSDEPDLGAFIYAIRRLPDSVADRAQLVILGQEREVFETQRHLDRRVAGGRRPGAAAALVRRRRRHARRADRERLRRRRPDPDAGGLPDRVEQAARAPARGRAGRPTTSPRSEECAEALGGTADDWARLREAWGERFMPRLQLIADQRMNMRLRMLGGTQVGYARMTRRWWQPVHDVARRAGAGGPAALLRQLEHAQPGQHRDRRGARARGGARGVRRGSCPRTTSCATELDAFREGRTEGSWENFLYFVARLYFDSHGEEGRAGAAALGGGVRRVAHPQHHGAAGAGADHPAGEAAARSGWTRGSATWTRRRWRRPRAWSSTSTTRSALAAYNILREVAVDSAMLRGVYVLGKAATLNADVGDVMLSTVVHDEHSGSTYWLDNAFSVDDIAPDLRFGSGLDNQRAVTVKSTFLQNRSYLDFYYREAFTVVEMEAGPYCNAIYEIADADRHPVGEAVNFSKLPVDFGIIHYASDTPYTQARTLGARGLSYYGMDSTYASSLAILPQDPAARGRARLARDHQSLMTQPPPPPWRPVIVALRGRSTLASPAAATCARQVKRG